LRLVIMSATLAVDAVAVYLGSCPIVASEGRLHPVELTYEARSLQQPWPVAAAAATERLLDRTRGDVLVFLPGLQEIRQTAHQLEVAAKERDLVVLPLHGDLPAEQQDAALLPQSRRKIVLATNVAETSVTVEGVTGVVDTGLARVMRFDANVGLDRLQLEPISQASAEQRAGRAGRTEPGVCVRLWSVQSQRARAEQTEPEIRRVDLAGAVLHLLSLGETEVWRFPWLEPPRADAVTQALTLLHRLGAIHETTVTKLGQILARLPVHPRLGRLLIEGQRFGVAERAAMAAALLSERDPFTRSLDQPRAAQHVSRSDVLDRVEALEQFERDKRLTSSLGTLHRNAAWFVLRARDQLLRSLRQEKRSRELSALPNGEDGLLRALLAAFPDRVARRREMGGRRGVMVGGRGVKLAPTSGVTEGELFLCIDVDSRAVEAFVRQASVVQPDWLPKEMINTTIEVAFGSTTERVTAIKRWRFDDLVLEEMPAALSNNEQTAAVLATAAGMNLSKVLPAEDSDAGRYLLRVRCLREWMPELELPSFDQTELRELLTWLCAGRRSFAELRTSPWLEALQGRLTHSQRQAVEREAPERIQVPSGSRLVLRYELGRPPVLAVRIQEMFGQSTTPRIAGGRVPVLLHLLAPNNRPQQITDDLASFWANTYAQVRKDLRARYPKHAWPEDPRTAPPQERPRRRHD
jgi:ATP-dependent helicase HrpB